FACFIFPNFRQGFFGAFRIGRIGNESAHPTDGRSATLMTGMDEQGGIGPHHRLGHGNGGSIWQNIFVSGVPEGFDDREDVVPSSSVQTGGMVAELVEDFFHLEGGGNGLDQYGGPDRTLWNAQVV